MYRFGVSTSEVTKRQSEALMQGALDYMASLPKPASEAKEEELPELDTDSDDDPVPPREADPVPHYETRHPIIKPGYERTTPELAPNSGLLHLARPGPAAVLPENMRSRWLNSPCLRTPSPPPAPPPPVVEPQLDVYDTKGWAMHDKGLHPDGTPRVWTFYDPNEQVRDPPPYVLARVIQPIFSDRLTNISEYVTMTFLDYALEAMERGRQRLAIEVMQQNYHWPLYHPVPARVRRPEVIDISPPPRPLYPRATGIKIPLASVGFPNAHLTFWDVQKADGSVVSIPIFEHGFMDTPRPKKYAKVWIRGSPKGLPFHDGHE